MSGKPHSSATRPGGRARSPVVLLPMLFVIGVLAVLLLYKPKPPPPAPIPAPAEPGPAASADAVTPGPQARPEYRPLQGRWLREDGGYRIEIRSVAPDGGLEAGYYNPRPIRVARAAAIKDEDQVKVLIELRDEGYPGSTYLLTYDAGKDALAGYYFQAATGQNFDVLFVREK